jgi:hypothetical protein
MRAARQAGQNAACRRGVLRVQRTALVAVADPASQTPLSYEILRGKFQATSTGARTQNVAVVSAAGNATNEHKTAPCVLRRLPARSDARFAGRVISPAFPLIRAAAKAH